MSNAIYPKFKEHLLKGDIDIDAATFKACLVDTAIYSYASTDEFLSAISGAGSPPTDARVGTDVTLSGVTRTNGVFDASDCSFTAVSGSTVEALVIYAEVGSPPTQYLVCYLDTGLGLPFTPSGTDKSVAWSNGASKIFAL